MCRWGPVGGSWSLGLHLCRLYLSLSSSFSLLLPGCHGVSSCPLHALSIMKLSLLHHGPTEPADQGLKLLKPPAQINLSSFKFFLGILSQQQKADYYSVLYKLSILVTKNCPVVCSRIQEDELCSRDGQAVSVVDIRANKSKSVFSTSNFLLTLPSHNLLNFQSHFHPFPFLEKLSLY